MGRWLVTISRADSTARPKTSRSAAAGNPRNSRERWGDNKIPFANRMHILDDLDVSCIFVYKSYIIYIYMYYIYMYYIYIYVLYVCTLIIYCNTLYDCI